MIETETTSSVATQFHRLETQVLELGQLAQAAISRAITAYLRRDTLMARAIIRDDRDIDQLEVEIHDHCLTILETDRPCGGDLRFVVAVLKINDSLERIGDLAENIADVIVEVGDWDRFRSVNGIQELGAQVQRMVGSCLKSLIDRDARLARQVIVDDGRADMLYEKVKGRIEYELDRIPENANPLLKLEYIARQLERMGDVSTNIAEEVIYLIEGRIVRHT